MDNKFPELTDDLELLKVRKENLELKAKLQAAEKILQENGLLEQVSSQSDEEHILLSQIGKMRELNDKGVPFTIEDVKILEILVKTLAVARGKAPIVEKEKKKKDEKPDIAKLLQLAGESDS